MDGREYWQRLAERYLFAFGPDLRGVADAAFARDEWREAALFARAAIENAAKAVLGALSSVPRSREPRDILNRAGGW